MANPQGNTHNRYVDFAHFVRRYYWGLRHNWFRFGDVVETEYGTDHIEWWLRRYFLPKDTRYYLKNVLASNAVMLFGKFWTLLNKHKTYKTLVEIETEKMSELLFDVKDKIPEGVYLELFNGLAKIRKNDTKQVCFPPEDMIDELVNAVDFPNMPPNEDFVMGAL